MKNLLFVLFILNVGSSFPQSKKEQIVILKKNVDSLNFVFENERNSNSKKVQDLNYLIRNFENQISSLNLEVKKASDNLNQMVLENTQMKNDLILKLTEISNLKRQLKNKNDSLNIVSNELQTPNETETKDVKDSKEIYFEGAVVFEYMYDYVWYINVKITKGELTGSTVNLYFQNGYTGTAEFSGDGDVVGKKINGIIILSTGVFDDMENGGTYTANIYIPKELNNM